MKMKQQSLFRLSKRPKERKKPPNSKTFKNNTKDGRKETQKVYHNSNPFPPNLCRILFTDVKHDRQEQFIFLGRVTMRSIIIIFCYLYKALTHTVDIQRCSSRHSDDIVIPATKKTKTILQLTIQIDLILHLVSFYCMF